ncbi:hypothetical protein Egran_01538 [Elaphomyces granulatus]|uniref:Integral membrane protein n=1 Tax=Elaphomyces granulatus TaxID=519963 RepID=A0A232M328_9EURO|nr:hypothetical protein Egran_01538 [Elaphomyces granulatus]
MSSCSPGMNQTKQAGGSDDAYNLSSLSQPPQSRKPSIGLRRLSSPLLFDNSHGLLDPVNQQTGQDVLQDEGGPSPRRRSNSEPRPSLSSIEFSKAGSSRFVTRASRPEMSPVTEETSSASHPLPLLALPPRTEMLGRNRASTNSSEYNPQIVDLLDVVDPEVSTLSTLTNVQNSLFVPNLGDLLNRTPTYTLSRPPPSLDDETAGETAEREEKLVSDRPHLHTSISSVIGEPPFAVLPDGSSLNGWTTEDVLELNDHVRHMLHSRRSKFKRAMKGFAQYASKPLGFLVTLYATLITLFGLAWVLFLIGWINVGGKQLYVINVIDNILVALFAIVGDGLAPFRAIDTYHMIYIAHYHHLTWRLREQRALPKLRDKNDLPWRREADADIERAGQPEKEPVEFTVLSPHQQERLEYHSTKFSKSHTFYKPHETDTHHAFPLRILIAIVVLLDCHSLLQISLGVCTWAINYHIRHLALTTAILCFSITCNIMAGVLIMIGDRKTRKTEVIKRMFRQELTKEVMDRIGKRRSKKQGMDKELEQ